MRGDGFWMVYRAIRAIRDVPAYDKLVLSALVDHFNLRSKRCCPKISLLMADLSLSRSSVVRALRSLRARRLLSTTRKKRHLNYVIHFDRLIAEAALPVGFHAGLAELLRRFEMPTDTAS